MTFIAFTPNLALDRTLELSRNLVAGELHRVARLREGAGGKGVNVARTLRAFGAEVVVAGFLAGFNGRKFRALLEREGLTGVFEEVRGETRECHILLDSHPHPTEVYERGPRVGLEDWRRLVRRLPPGQVILSGSLPEGIGPEAFRALLPEFAGRPVVDASGKALEVALEAGAALVKPNLAELASVVPIRTDALSAARDLVESYGVPVLLTLGEGGAAYVESESGDESLFVPAPTVDATNPVASGDALLAAFLWARSNDWPTLDALRLGVAAGAENAASGGAARLTREGVMARLERMS